MASIGFLPLDLGDSLGPRDSGAVRDERVEVLESGDDLCSWDQGRTKEEVAGREERIDAFFNSREQARRAWIEENAEID